MIRVATEEEFENFVLPLIRRHQDYLQQEPWLPRRDEFMVLKLRGSLLGCIALKEYGKKLSEIQSLVFINTWLEWIFGLYLILYAIRKAKTRKTKQLLVTLGLLRHRVLFGIAMFHSFRAEKYGLLRLAKGLEPYLERIEARPLKGFIIEDLAQAEYETVRSMPFSKQILTDPEYFPACEHLCVVKNEAGEIVGCCGFIPFERRSPDGRIEMGEVRTLFVLPQYATGFGLGQHLCANRCRRAIDLGVIELFAVTGPMKKWFEDNFGFSVIQGSEKAFFKTLKK
jgi:N-acetylglutamate synthase-like GNAT family acetyltransferase